MYQFYDANIYKLLPKKSSQKMNLRSTISLPAENLHRLLLWFFDSKPTHPIQDKVNNLHQRILAFFQTAFLSCGLELGHSPKKQLKLFSQNWNLSILEIRLITIICSLEDHIFYLSRLSSV